MLSHRNNSPMMANMVRAIAILSMVGLACAAILALLPDPWVKAEQKAAQDAEKLAQLIATPAKISWRLTEDVSLLRAMVWDADYTRRYPPISGYGSTAI